VRTSKEEVDTEAEVDMEDEGSILAEEEEGKVRRHDGVDGEEGEGERDGDGANFGATTRCWAGEKGDGSQ